MGNIGAFLNHLFQKKIRAVLEFQNNKFLLYFLCGQKPYSASMALKNPALAFYITQQQYEEESSICLSYTDAKRILELQPAFSNEIVLEIAQSAREIEFRFYDGQFLLHLVWTENGMLKLQLPLDACYLDKGVFLYRGIIWQLPSEAPFIYLERPACGIEILKLFSKRLPSFIVCHAYFSKEEILNLEVFEEKSNVWKITANLLYPPSQWIPIEGLIDYVRIGNHIFPISFRDFLEKWFPQNLQISFSTEQFYHFVQENKALLWRYGSKGLLEIIENIDDFWQVEEISFYLSCTAIEKRGKRQAVAVPVCQFGDFYCDTIELSSRLGENIFYLNRKWVGSQTLQKLGIGPIGRLTDGTKLAPIYLDIQELLFRGSDRLYGIWKGFLFDESDWLYSGNASCILESHLLFLQKYGISGGIVLESERISDFVYYLENTSFSPKTLVLMRKKFLDGCKKEEQFLNTLTFRGEKKDPPIPEQVNQTIVCTYSAFGKSQFLQQTNWDRIIFVEADEQFKTEESIIFKNVKKLSSAIKLCFVTKDTTKMKPQQLKTLLSLLELPSNINLDLLKYLIRNLNDSLSLPAPYDFKHFSLDWEQKNKLENSNFQKPLIGKDWIERFVHQAHSYTHFIGKKSNFVPFTQYWPTYETMDAQQYTWYFYWRSNVRKKLYIETSLSYILLYIYELIHGIGYSSPKEGYQLLLEVWYAYRDTFSKLDQYLCEWSIDFLSLNHLWTENIELPFIKSSNDIFYNLYLQQKYLYFGKRIELEDLLHVASFLYEKSRFYLENKQQLLEQDWGIAFFEIDNVLQEKFQKNLISFFTPASYCQVSRYAYLGAVYKECDAYTVSYLPFTQHQPFIEFIDSVLKEVENRRRAQFGFLGRLRGIYLEEIFLEAIEKAMKRTDQKDCLEQPTGSVSLEPSFLVSKRTIS